jgi:long-subunit fatty acid transport protein
MLKKAISRFIFFILFIRVAFAQNITHSPYSVVGVGDIQYAGNAQQGAMGQVSQAIRKPYELNNLNPASYSALERTVIDVGVNYANGTIKSVNQTTNIENFTFAYFAFGFPISRKLGLGATFGLQPYSSIGYNLQSTTDYPGVDGASTNFTGRGGLSRFYFGSGINLNKNFSFGFNISYLFGQLQSTQVLMIPPSYNQFNLSDERKTTVGDFNWQFGLQYRKKINKDRILTAGLSYALGNQLNASRDNVVRTVLSDGLSTIDTISIANGEKGTIKLPYFLRGGIAFEKKDKWLITADGQYSNWKDFRAFGQSDSLKNCIGVNAGLSYMRNAFDYKHYLNRIEYRLGGRFDNGMLEVEGHNISQYGVSAGMGFPLGLKGASKVNITFEYYVRGRTAYNLIKEEYFKFTLGITFSDTWFIRSKYD